MPTTVATLAVGLVVQTGKAFKQLDTGLGKLAGIAAIGGKAIAVGIGVGTAAVTAFAAKSVSVATDFQSQMAIMSTAIEPMGPSLEEMHAAMLKVGADNELIGITASEAAEATTNFYKAGLATNDIFGDYNAYMEEGASLTGALRASIDLAAASDLELAEASSLVAISMAQYGLEAANATEITDVFVKAADASQAEVSDLSVAMSYVGPTANAMGISIEDTAIALAMLSEGGIKGSSAGTSLNRVLSDLGKTSPKAQKAMAALGIEMYDAEGVMKPLPELLAHINEKLGDEATITEVVGGVTKELTKAYEKANTKIPALTTTISEQEQQLAILNDELPLLIEYYGEGSIAVDKKRLAITKLTNNIEENKAKLGEHLKAVDEYKGALDGATTSTRKLTEQEREEYKAAIFTTQGRRGMNVLLSEGAEGWERMAEKVETASSAEEVAAARTNTFAGTMEKFGGTMETLQIMVGDTLLPVLGRLADKFNEFIGNYTPQIVAGFEKFARVIDKVITAGEIFFTGLATGQEPLEAIRSVLTYLLPEGMVDKIMNFGETLKTTFETTRDTISDVITFLVDEVWPKLVEAFETIKAWSDENWPAIKETFQETWGTIQDVIESVVVVIVEDIWPKLQGIFDELTGVLDDFGLTWGDVWDAVKRAVTIVLGIVGGLILGLVGIVLGVVSGVLAGLRNMIAGWRRLRRGLEEILEGIATTLGGFIEIVKGILEGDWERVVEGFNTIAEGWKTTINGILESIKGFFTATFGSIYTAVSEFVETVSGFFSDLYQRLVGGSIVPDIMDGILGFFEELPGKLLDALGGLAEGIGDLLKGLFGPILEFDPTQVAEMFSLLTEGLIELGELWTVFMTKLNETWMLFSAYLLEESWPLLTETFMMMLTTWQTLWQAAMIVLEEAFRRLVEIVLEGIEIMIEAWNQLREAIIAVANAVSRVVRAIEKLASDKMLEKLDELRSVIGKIADKFKKMAEAAEDAYNWAKKAAEVGGGGGGGEPPPAQAGIWNVAGHPVRRLDPQEMVVPARPAQMLRSMAGGFGDLARMLGAGGLQIGPNYISDDYDFEAKVKRVLVNQLGVT